MRVVFMGTPEFSVSVLDALVDAGHEIVAVYSQPPRPAGRGKKDRPSPVQARAEALGLPVRHPVSLKGEVEQAEFAAFEADIALVVAYGLAGTVNIDMENDPIGQDKEGNEVYLKDIWYTREELNAALAIAANS